VFFRFFSAAFMAVADGLLLVGLGVADEGVCSWVIRPSVVVVTNNLHVAQIPVMKMQ